MLPGYVAGHYSFDEVHLDLQRICRFSDIRLIHAACTDISYDSGGGGWIGCGDGDDDPPTRIHYDVTSIDVGSTPGATDWSILQHPRVIPVKPIANFCERYQAIQESFSVQATSPTPTTINPSLGGVHRVAVVGGGAGGVELILSIQKNLQDILRRNPQQNHIQLEMILVTRGSILLEQSNPAVQRVISRILGERKVQVLLSSPVERVVDRDGASFLYVAATPDCPAEEIPFDHCFWCTNAAGAAWLSEKTPFPCNDQGFVKVESTYQVVDHPGVFAAGDCAHRIENPRPKAGVFAVRAGPPVLENTMAALLGQPLKPHVPQSIFLSIISTGSGYAVAARGPDFCQEGRWVWKWKDRIDRYVVASRAFVVADPLPNKSCFLQINKFDIDRGWQSIQAKFR
jgi:selenide, water dikinase